MRMKDTAQRQPAIAPAGRRFDGSDRRAPLRNKLESCGEYHAGQTAGRFYPVACVALEVTQRCNLDCTLCYLSDRAEMTYDPPLSVLFARLATIRSFSCGLPSNLPSPRYIERVTSAAAMPASSSPF